MVSHRVKLLIKGMDESDHDTRGVHVFKIETNIEKAVTVDRITDIFVINFVDRTLSKRRVMVHYKGFFLTSIRSDEMKICTTITIDYYYRTFSKE